MRTAFPGLCCACVLCVLKEDRNVNKPQKRVMGLCADNGCSDYDSRTTGGMQGE